MDVFKLALVDNTPFQFIASCIQRACGDLILEDVRVHDLITKNSIPTRIWDFIYSRLHLKATQSNGRFEAVIVKRGPWEMILLLDTVTGLLFSIMREERYKQLCMESPESRRFHYARCLAGEFNSELPPLAKQIKLPGIDDSYEQAVIEKIVTSMLDSSGFPTDLIKHHALVLFSARDFEVQSIRCVMVDRDFDIIEQVSWNNLLLLTESVVSDTVNEQDSPHDNPTRGLKLTPKAMKKQEQQLLKYQKDNQNTITIGQQGE
ncbi:MAG: DUF5986 family protein [Candidatus Limiplasma sp.]|nr:DUF5986 family protein [Candidatus Limiplasma sp.]